MRLWVGAATLLLLANVAFSTELDELLKTPQYLVISQYNCETIYEMNVASKTCPRALVIPRLPRQSGSLDCKIPYRAHLIRDPSQKFPPKLFFLGPGSHNRGIAGILENIELPSDEDPSRNKFSYSQQTTLDKTGTKFFDNRKTFNYRDVVGSIYDASSQMLFVIANVRSSQLCSVYYLENVFNSHTSRGPYDNFSVRYMSEFVLHSSNGARFGWVEDPYNNTVYYSTDEGNAMALYAVPISRLLPVLKDGLSGHVVTSILSEKRTHYRVAGNGAIISLGDRDGFPMAYIRSIEQSVGIVCSTRHMKAKDSGKEEPPLELPDVMPIIIVRDDDFCMLRDGWDADLNACADERQQWLRAKGLDDSESGIEFLVILAIVVVIVLATIILLLLVCICWLKRSLDETIEEEPHRPVQYYQQPAQYVDMDVSVDRWNY